MLFPIANVLDNPLQILRSKTDDTIAGLPFEHFAIDQLRIHVMRTRALQLPDPIGDYKGGRNADDHMNVRLGASDFMKDHGLRLKGVAANISMQARLNLGADDRQTAFHMPGDVKIDFTINVSRDDSAASPFENGLD